MLDVINDDVNPGEVYHVTLQFDLLCVCVMVTKYSPSPSLNCKLSFVWRQILISFRGKSHSGHSGGASLGISRMESLICRNSSQLKFNRTIVNSGTASGKVGARTEQQNLSEKLNRTESWDRLHTLRLHNQSSYHRRKRAGMSPHLLLGGVAKHWSLVGGWLVGSSHLTHGGWQSTGSSPTVGRSQTHCTPGRAPALAPGRVVLLLKYASYWPRENIGDTDQVVPGTSSTTGTTWSVLLKYARYWPRENICLKSWEGNMITSANSDPMLVFLAAYASCEWIL